jgi:YD repeat-containing protein
MFGHKAATTVTRHNHDGNLFSLEIGGQITGYTYDSHGNRTGETDVLGYKTTYTHDSDGRELTRTDENGQQRTLTTSKAYDAEGRVIQETDVLGGITKTTWNTTGKMTSSTSPQGWTTTSSGRYAWVRRIGRIVGSLLVRNWGVPSNVGTAIRFHHEPDAYDLPDGTLPATALSLIAVTQVAEHLITEMQNGDDLEVGEERYDRALAHLGIAECELDGMREDLEAILT